MKRKNSRMKQWLGLAPVAAAIVALAPTAQAAISLPDPSVVGPYRIAFITSNGPSGSRDMASLNAWVTGQAQAVGAVDAGGQLGTTWSVIGATTTVSVFDNTDTEPGVDTDYPIYMVNGVLFADTYTNLWNGTVAAANQGGGADPNPPRNNSTLYVTETGAGVNTNPSYAHTGLIRVGNLPATSSGYELDSTGKPSKGFWDSSAAWYGQTAASTWGDLFGGPSLYAISGVIGGAPPAADPEITSITSLGGGVFELTLKGANSTSYEFYSSATLDFTSGGTLVSLTGGGTDVTTDGSGDATVQMTLTGSANFVRAQ